MNLKKTFILNRGLRLLPLLAVLFLLPACQPQELKVYLEIKLPDRINLADYKTLVVSDLAQSGFPQDLDTAHVQTDFFLGDLPRQYRLKVHRSPQPVPDPEQLDPALLTDLAASHEKPVFLTGRLALTTQENSMVRERRDEKIGKRIRSIVKLNQMILKMDLFIYNPSDGKLLWKKSYTQQANEYPSDKTAFTFRSLFYKCTDRFSRDIGLQERRVRRTLIDK